MRKKHLFTPFENQWSIEKWQNLCPEMSYKEISLVSLPNWLPNGLVSKFNSAVIASSGNTESIVFIIMGYRVDNDKIDEHPYVVAFDKISGRSFSGFIHHGDYAGRTTKIPNEMMSILKQHGISVPLKLSRKPKKSHGTLTELRQQGILTGYEIAVRIVEKARLLLVRYAKRKYLRQKRC